MGEELAAEYEPGEGHPRILFVGWPHSTHTHSWIELLRNSEFNVRLFALPGALPPVDWQVRTYVSKPNYGDPGRLWIPLYPRGRVRRAAKWAFAHYLGGGVSELPERWLSEIIRTWRPHIIHTLGLDPAGFFYHRVRRRFDLFGIGSWVLQLRGGSDLTLARLDPDVAPRISSALEDCDQLVSDNEVNYGYAFDLGLREEQVATLGPVPGTGGVDVDSLSSRAHSPPSARRIVVWPKAYDCQWSLALPVFEALRMVWTELQPCEIFMLAMTSETRQWFRTLPDEIRARCHPESRVPRERTLDLIAQARVMLAPSLIDGTPNTLFEAMASGALPIVSPLETIRPVVNEHENVLFARNLYPEEIGQALSRAMSDDALVEATARANHQRVKELADRSVIRERVLAFYRELVSGS